MLNVFINAWKVKEIRKKLFYILLMLAIYRIGSHIGLPGINAAAILAAREQSAQNIFALITGGGAGTLFAMGIGPYITSSIIMQLLTVAIPALERIQKEGEEGRKKINQYTRVLAVGLSLLQASGTVYSLRADFTHPNMFVYITAVVALVTGTIFVMWMSELLTERGIGNGSSFIIFANILSSLPRAIASLSNKAVNEFPIGTLQIVAMLLIFLFIIGFVVWIQDGERRIPVQYSKKMVGRQQFGGQSSYIPIKVNIAGVMSIIFAISLLQFPQTIGQFLQAGWIKNTVNFLSMQAYPSLGAVSTSFWDHPYGAHPITAIIYVVLIFCFTFFYTSFAINPTEMAENMKKNGGFIPGIRPGRPTTEYIERTVHRLSWIGAVFYSIIALIPLIIEWVFGIAAGFGGTTLLIVTGVALELVKQLESQLLMRHHKGFLN